MGATIHTKSDHDQALFFAAPFSFAHLRFCAAAIRARASGLRVRFFLGSFGSVVEFRPARRERACWRREISESISDISCAVSMPIV